MQASSPSPGLFFDTVNAFQRTQALQTAVELDLFTHLAEGPRTADDLASATAASQKGVRILADYLTIVGFLQKSNDKYSLTPDSKMFLNRHSPAYLGGTLKFLLTPALTEYFAKLTEAVRHGGTTISGDGTVSHDNPIWVDFARAMAPLMQLPAQLLVGLVGGQPTAPLRILDVAAGHGMFGITLAKHFPNAQVTALDWQNVLEVARDNALKAGIQDRFHLRPGSAFQTDWGGPYEIVLLTNFFHHFDLQECEQIARRAHQALVSGGRAITLEFIPGEDRISPPTSASFALTMLATTARGDAYTFRELDQVLNRAGFSQSEFHPLPPTMQQAIVSTRP